MGGLIFDRKHAFKVKAWGKSQKKKRTTIVRHSLSHAKLPINWKDGSG